MLTENETLVKGHSEVFSCVHYGQFFRKENDGRDRDLTEHLTGSEDAEFCLIWVDKKTVVTTPGCYTVKVLS